MRGLGVAEARRALSHRALGDLKEALATKVRATRAFRLFRKRTKDGTESLWNVAGVLVETAEIHLEAEQYEEAVLLLREATGLRDELLARKQKMRGLMTIHDRTYLAARILAGQAEADTAEARRGLAEVHHRGKRYDRAVLAWRLALQDDEVKSDPGALYDAACSASLRSAVTSLQAAEREALQKEAITWLRSAFVTAGRRASRAQAVGAPAEEVARHRALLGRLLTQAEKGDADLAPLRALPAFQALFRPR